MATGYYQGAVPTGLTYTRRLLLLPKSTEKSSFSWFRIPAPASTEVPEGSICWGQTGELPSGTPMPTYGFTVTSKHTEISREESPVRITNPDDNSQYIMVNRADSILFNVLNRTPSSGGTNTSSAPAQPVNPKMVPAGGAVQQTGTLRMDLKNGPNSL